MKSNYNDCLVRLLKDEGGYSNDPNDSGGPTNFGITLADYRKYIKANGTAADVKNMTVDQAKAIYKPKYWDALDCDNLSSGVDYTCFDYGVNSGLGRPRKALQKFKGKTGVDLIDAINNERAAFLQAIGAGKNARFEAGWQARVKRVRNYSKFLAANPPKDAVSGPAAGVVAGGGLFYSMWGYIHLHPVASVAAVLAVSAFVWWVVHSIRNSNV